MSDKIGPSGQGVKRGKSDASPRAASAKRPARAATRRPARPRRVKIPYSDEEITEIFRRFSVQRPEPVSELAYTNPFTLLVAVVLSAQATDAGVNKATRELFHVADNAAAIALYRGEGFRPIGTYLDYYADHETALRFEKTLRGDHPIDTGVPYYEQTTDFTCGACCLMMAMGRDIPGFVLEPDVARRNTTVEHLIKMIRIRMHKDRLPGTARRQVGDGRLGRHVLDGVHPYAQMRKERFGKNLA